MNQDQAASLASQEPARGPDHRWTIFGYTFAIYTFREHPQRWRWECSAHGRGVGGHRTPVGAFFALRRWMRVPGEADMTDWPCSICGGPTVYQSFSGGREWYCAACDTTGEYPADAPGLPRATLLRTPEGAVTLRAQMDQELARRAEVGHDRT